jgi:hypothetical protein
MKPKTAIILGIAQAPLVALIASEWGFTDWQMWVGIAALAWATALTRAAQILEGKA